MKTRTFKQIIDNLIDKGVKSIKIMRSDVNCGFINKNDIISIEVVHKNGRIYIASVCEVFSEPIIAVDRIIRNEAGRCIDRFTIGQYKYAI